MPQPNRLGHVAKNALYLLVEQVQEGMREIPDIGHYTRAGNFEEARRAEQRTLDIALLTIRVASALISDDIADAEKIGLDYKNKQK